MKKTLTLLLVAFVCVSAFATSTVGVGFATDFFSGRGDIGTGTEDAYSTFGIGVNAKGEFELDPKFGIYADASILFPSAYRTGSDEVTKETLKSYVSDCTSISVGMSLANINAGVFYSFLDEGPFLVKAGGGLELETFRARATGTYNSKTKGLKLYVTNFGLSFFGDASYMVSDELSVGLTVIPKMSVYSNITTVDIVDGVSTADASGSGFKVGFAVKASVSATYHFL